MSAQLVRSAATFKRLQGAARDALRAARELERARVADMFGSYLIEKGETLDSEIEGEVIGLLRLAREVYPTQQLEVIVVANP